MPRLGNLDIAVTAAELRRPGINQHDSTLAGRRNAHSIMTDLEPILGYLNFAEGRPDPRFQRTLDDAYTELAAADPAPWILLRKNLDAGLERLRKSGKAAFKETTQAAALIRLVFDEVVPAYRRHHADLLFHLGDADFHAPFFLARVAEAAFSVQQGPREEYRPHRRGGPQEAERLHRPSPHRHAQETVGSATSTILRRVGLDPALFSAAPASGEGPYRPLCRPGDGARAPPSTRRALQRDLLRPCPARRAGSRPLLTTTSATRPTSAPATCFGGWDPHHLDGKSQFLRLHPPPGDDRGAQQTPRESRRPAFKMSFYHEAARS